MSWRRCVVMWAVSSALGGCYQTAELKVTVRAPPGELACEATADRVFAEQNFERIRTVSGIDMFYTPRTTASASIALQWGIAVMLKKADPDLGCVFELVTLSMDPGCGIQCGLSPQRGEDYDRTLEEMARRLRRAFGPPPG